jgi:hypothetical protein
MSLQIDRFNLQIDNSYSSPRVVIWHENDDRGPSIITQWETMDGWWDAS